MGTVTLLPGHLRTEWYHEIDTVWPSSIRDLMPYFFYSVEVDPSFTLGDLFRMLDRDDADTLAAILSEHVVPLLEEARLPPEPDDGLPLRFLHVYNTHERGYLHREFGGWARGPSRTKGRGSNIPTHRGSETRSWRNSAAG